MIPAMTMDVGVDARAKVFLDALRANADAYHYSRVTYADFSATQRELWDAIEGAGAEVRNLVLAGLRGEDNDRVMHLREFTLDGHTWAAGWTRFEEKNGCERVYFEEGQLPQLFLALQAAGRVGDLGEPVVIDGCRYWTADDYAWTSRGAS